ncbi:MAG: phage protein Gp36 family protein [Bacteroidota bacterium]
MFLTKADLKSAIYEYQLNEIVEVTADDTSNDDIILMAIGAAIEEMKSYLSPNMQDRYKDGRSRYDVSAIFSATGSNRNPLILELCKNMTVWYLCRLCNVDIIQEKVKERYDRAIDWLEKISGTGKSAGAPSINPDLPKLSFDPATDDSLSWRMGSREKFSHE